MVDMTVPEMGPSVDMTLRRNQEAADDLMKEALRQPAASNTKPKKVKNDFRGRKISQKKICFAEN